MTSLDPTASLRRLPPITAAARAAERAAAARTLADRLGRLVPPAPAEARPEVRRPAPDRALVAARDLPPLVAARMIVPLEALPRAGEGRRERMPDEVADVVLVVPVRPFDFVAEDEAGRAGADAGSAGARRRRVRVAEIKRAVAAEFGISLVDLASERRTRPVVRPRQLAMWLAAKLTTASSPDIGRAFGGRDHTTVLHALKATEARLAEDAELAARAAAVLARLGVGIEP